MKKTYTQKVVAIAACCFLYLLSYNSFAQVGIGNTNPDESSLLDIRDANGNTKGLLIPRVSIGNLGLPAPVTSPETSLLVYNTNGATGSGFYYWNGTRWTQIDGGRNWNLRGNAGTIAGTDFLGTTDNISLRFRTFNNDRFEISSGNANNAGRLRAFSLGSNTQPTYSWSGDANTGIYSPSADQLGFSTNATERFRIPNANQVHAMSDGTASLPFYSWSSDADIGMYRIGTNVLGLSTAGTERVRVAANGNVGIGANNPTQRLEVTGNLRLNGAFMPNNQAGTNDKILISKGPVTAPAWGPGFLNTDQITNIGKFYVQDIYIAARTALTLTVTDPNMTRDTALAYNFVGVLPSGPDYARDLSIMVESRTGVLVFHINNESNYNLSNFQIAYTAFYH